MKSINSTIPLFPLSTHILPGGSMTLRIFEPRYVDMVKRACKDGSGFGVCMFNSLGEKSSNQHIHPIGTYVTITDFDLLDDGLLGIIIEAQRCFKIQSITTAKDQLRIGEVKWLENWQNSHTDISQYEKVGKRLREIFAKYPEVKTRYQTPLFEDPVWVTYRWLELLPVQAEQKQQLLMQKDVSIALDFLAQFIE